MIHFVQFCGFLCGNWGKHAMPGAMVCEATGCEAMLRLRCDFAA
ncbi:MAG: hypothetical protein ACO331_07600 [Prochlorothrix sp.]